MIAVSPIESFFLDSLGLKEVTGTYINWMPFGFMIWVEGRDLPVSVVSRKDSFHDYPGDYEPQEDKMVHVIGRLEPDGLTIHAVRWWFEK